MNTAPVQSSLPGVLDVDTSQPSGSAGMQGKAVHDMAEDASTSAFAATLAAMLNLAHVPTAAPDARSVGVESELDQSAGDIAGYANTATNTCLVKTPKNQWEKYGERVHGDTNCICTLLPR